MTPDNGSSLPRTSKDRALRVFSASSPNSTGGGSSHRCLQPTWRGMSASNAAYCKPKESSSKRTARRSRGW